LSSDFSRGTDGRLYIIDVARVFPPTTPPSNMKGVHLYRLLRPELVKSNLVPLCSDAFSSFHLEDRIEHEEEVKEATRRLEEEVIPKFAAYLDDYYTKNTLNSTYLRNEFPKLIASTHRKVI
jgi:hypothetical protein